jgi:hypothetical protein
MCEAREHTMLTRNGDSQEVGDGFLLDAVRVLATLVRLPEACGAEPAQKLME